MMTFALLLPTVFLMAFAHLGRRHSAFAVLTYALLVFINVMFVTVGILILVGAFVLDTPDLVIQSDMVLPTARELGLIGGTVLVSGLVAFVLLLPTTQRLLTLFMRIEPGDPVHTTALAFACYVLGTTLAQAPLLAAMERMGEDTFRLPQSELWGQAVALILLALAGVGLGINRPPGAAARRLGLTWPGRREISTAIIGTFGLIFMQSLLGAAWMIVSPESLERVNKLSELLLGDLFNPWGAVVIGLTAGVSEELVFRGALQPRFGLLATSLLFSFIHAQYAFSFAWVIVFLLGLVLGLLRKYVNTTTAILTHMLYNTTLVLLAIYAPNLSP